MICANISRIIYCPVMLLYYRAFFFRSPRLPFIHQERFEQMCRGRGAKCRQGDIYIFFIFLSFLKIPYLKIVENFVLSCKPCIFVIYYINNQIFIRCTIFVRNRTIRTKVHKILFCTEHYNFVLKSTAFCTEITS